jgi:hypothetical protein
VTVNASGLGLYPAGVIERMAAGGFDGPGLFGGD